MNMLIQIAVSEVKNACEVHVNNHVMMAGNYY